jgi:hypothetical protein
LCGWGERGTLQAGWLEKSGPSREMADGEGWRRRGISRKRWKGLRLFQHSMVAMAATRSSESNAKGFDVGFEGAAPEGVADRADAAAA